MADVPPGVVTVMSTTDEAVPAGLAAVSEVLETTTTDVPALPPNDTLAPTAKFVPVIVTVVPPLAGPASGLIAVVVGGAS